jgi:hypothetical protein
MSDGRAGDIVAGFRTSLPHLQHLRPGRRLRGSEALNYGIERAASDKIAILDDDNLYDPTHLRELVHGLERTGADLVYTGARRTTYTIAGDALIASAVWHHPFDLQTLLVGNYIHTCATAFWKRTWQRLGGFDPRFEAGDDLDFLIRVAVSGRIECLPAVTAESRSFTGQHGLRYHALETRVARRAQAGLYWCHRRLFYDAWPRIAAERFDADGRLLPRERRPLWRSALRRARRLGDLLDWWWHAR